jgi:poly-gamma-glutamate synthesis protein (capsule biosynthesis protein)
VYFPQLDAETGRLVRFAMTPTRIHHLRVERAPDDGVRWLLGILNREGRQLGTRVERQPDDSLVLHWRAH